MNLNAHFMNEAQPCITALLSAHVQYKAADCAYIPVVLVSWISSYLYNRKQQVGVCGVNSDPISVTSGVPQDSVLGPLLLLIYVDGPTSIPLNGGSLVVFADDLLLYKVILGAGDFLTLQEDVTSPPNT